MNEVMDLAPPKIVATFYRDSTSARRGSTWQNALSKHLPDFGGCISTDEAAVVGAVVAVCGGAAAVARDDVCACGTGGTVVVETAGSGTTGSGAGATTCVGV